MRAEERLDELARSLFNYERDRTGTADWSLDTTRALLCDPASRPRRIQVGGSKGKGTTVAYLDALARDAGLRTCTYTSPHLSHMCERVCFDGVPVPAGDLVAALEAVLARAAEQALRPSYFEALTVAAVDLADAAGVDLMILEVGLGGRLDATTAVEVDGTILVHLELEHTDVLGDDLLGIAREKAHIMRPGAPAWLPPLVDPDCEALLREHATSIGALLQKVPGFKLIAEQRGGLLGRLDNGRPFWLPGASRFEVPAFVLAFAALDRLFPGLELRTEPVPRPALPGRFEVLERPEGRYVLDVAHTPNSLGLCLAEWRYRFGAARPRVLFGTAANKPWQELLSQLSEVADSFVVTSLPETRSADPEAMAAFLSARGHQVVAVEDPAAGLELLRVAGPDRLVVGSNYLVGAIRPQLSEHA